MTAPQTVPDLVMDNPQFEVYLSRCTDYISKNRIDLNSERKNVIISANAPKEFSAAQRAKNQKHKYGVLMVHGLLDSPFSFDDLGIVLKNQGFIARSILLPGHGTKAQDLHHVSYHDWINTVRYGVQSLKSVAENVFVIGYSTGATLAAYLATFDEDIAGIVMLTPAIEIKVSEAMVTTLYSMQQYLKRPNKDWIYLDEEIDYVKYRSVCFNGYSQVTQLTKVLANLQRERPLKTPLYMILTQQDGTISSPAAIEYFNQIRNPKNRLLIYAGQIKKSHDARIIYQSSQYPHLNIRHFSHISIPFAADNFHYGVQGDYAKASRSDGSVYGGFSKLETQLSKQMTRLGFNIKPKKELTYNPDFPHMSERIIEFMHQQSS